MKTRVEELLHENLALDTPALLSSVAEINVTITAGKVYRDSFRIGTANGRKIRGTVYSNNRRIIFAADTFSGSSCSIVYGIDTHGLSSECKIYGNIVVLSCIGELHIPVCALIEEESSVSLRKANNLESFARVASADFREAFLLFKSEDFKELLRGKNSRYIPLYKGLSQNPVTYQHLEEFLIATGKKEAVRLSVDKQGKASYVLNNSIKDTLYIYKSTWGYTRIEVSTLGGFIELEKKVITSEDFIGRVYGLEFVLNKNELKKRHCHGKISLKTAYQTLEIEVEAYPYEDIEQITPVSRKANILRLLRLFLALQMKKKDYRSWYDESMQIVEQMVEEKQDLFTRFVQAFLAYSKEEMSLFAKLLWPIKTGEIKTEQPWEKAVYLYLAKEADILPQEGRNIAPRLYAYYRQDPTNYLILALYLKEAKNDHSSVWNLAELENAYEFGCRSPFLFLSAWKILSAQESLLRKLSPFLMRVLQFAQQEDLLSENLLLRTAFLAANVKSFHRSLYTILSLGYEKYGRREILEAICRYIMNDDPTSPRYFKWYEKAVSCDIRLNRLYEYYLETHPKTLDEPLPMAVKLYFSYSLPDGERRKAFLFASVIKFKEQSLESYELYKEAARHFAEESLKAERIDEFYAILYREFFDECDDRKTAELLSKVMFSRKLKCSNPNMIKAVVCHAALCETESFPIIDGTAYPKIYGNDVCILLEDGQKRRFAEMTEYELTPLMDSERLSKACIKLGAWNTGIQLSVCHERGWQMEITRRNISNFIYAAENPAFTDGYREQIRKKLLDYLVKNSNDWEMLPYVKSIDEIVYAHIDKEETLKLLLHFGQYDRAFYLINNMGYEGFDNALLMKLALIKIDEDEEGKDKNVLELALYVYQNECFNDEILEYISAHGVFDISSAEELLKRMENFGMDTFRFEERYLLLSMFVMKPSSFSERVLDDYSKKGGRIKIKKAFLNFLSMYYLLKERSIKKSTAAQIEMICADDYETSTLCDVAWAKYKAAEGDFSQSDREVLKKVVERCAANGLRFDFFKELPEDITEICALDDKVFAQESLPPGCKATIHYRIDSAKRGKGEWKSEPFRASIQGLYVREFLLFYGERLTYYCNVETRDGAYKTQVKSLKVEESNTEGRTRYQLLNRMLMQRSLKAYGKAEETMKEYLKREAFTDKMFSLRT